MPTLTVNILADQNDGSSAGGLSLRDAILTANADPNTAYTINLQAGQTYLLSAGEADEDLGVGGDLDITNSNITVRSAGRQPATIDAGGLQFSDRVFHVLEGGNLTLENVVLTRGNTEFGGGLRIEEAGTATLVNSTVSGNTAEDGGGGIYTEGTTTLIQSTVSNNSTTTSNSGGAGIRSSGTLTLTDSTVSENSSTASFSSGAGISSSGTATLTQSSVSNNSSFSGGGISNGGSMTLTNTTVSDNTATNSSGGGILSSGFNNAVLNLIDSTVSGNSSDLGGGGISSNDTLNLLNSTISNNASARRDGGGVEISGNATITNTTISGNSAINGGGIAVGSSFINTAVLTNSTVSGNSATDNGGGIYLRGGTATLTNSTIANNTVNTDRDSRGNGGGISNRSTLTLRNSIVAENIDLPDNAGAGEIHPDLSGTINGSNFNLIGTVEGATGNVGSGSDIVTSNPLLGPLAENGGPTLTHTPLQGSPAINRGNSALVAPDTLDIDADNNFTEPVPSDQRLRQRIAGPSVDIGSVEVGAAPLPPNFIARTGPSSLLTPIETTSSPVPAFADLDADGDLDATVGDINGGLLYFRNDTNRFTRVTGAPNPFAGIDVGFVSTPAFADLDGDSDLDLFIGAFDGTFTYYRNTNGRFVEQTGSANPFNGIDVGSYSNIAFANIDGDSDVDAFLGLANGRVAYYRNTNGNFTLIRGTGNPLNGLDAGDFSFPSFGDLDGDGDEDAVVGEVFGELRYYRNDGGRLVSATGTNNPLNGVDVGFYAAPSFADIDGDGDVDGIIGGDVSLSGTSRGRLSLIENTLPVGSTTVQRDANAGSAVRAGLGAGQPEESLLGGTLSHITATSEGFEELTWSAESTEKGFIQEQEFKSELSVAALTSFDHTVI
ncbi:MAG: FG-GAP-like repeat-containing protein [Cyanophyceae cyanobacterium]